MRNRFSILLGALLLGSSASAESAQLATDAVETKYLLFQVCPAMPGFSPIFPPVPGRMALTKEQLADFARGVTKAIGMTGDARQKLGFTIGPLCFDMPDGEIRQWMRDAFAVARGNDVAVAFHIDDSMFWGQRKDLLSNPDNIETADWKQIPNTGRRLDWGLKPTKAAPQMCFNVPAIVTAVQKRAELIGAEITRELPILKAQGKAHLFAGVIAGWETQIGPDWETGKSLGFRALAHRGFSEKRPPKDLDAERVSVVKEWIELWANLLHAGGTPREKIFCHIAFTSQGLAPEKWATTGAQKARFAPAEVAFSAAYRPGFSTYPEGTTFSQIHDALAVHGGPGWISAEGVNVSPTGMPGEPTMETYLGRIFNHGGVLANVFSWGIGGEAQRTNFFRLATESPECLAAYSKFLRGEKLAESAARRFSASALQEKMHRIQTGIQGYRQEAGLMQKLRMKSLMQKLDSLINGKKWLEADQVADEVWALISEKQMK
ncbi:MAG: hypothetical protein EPN23_09340 [Verrucomicrobia bacterium]|nr:MAG: hypothetical protein EPN23_09340 [Verrucomicrobiota bacterium]